MNNSTASSNTAISVSTVSKIESAAARSQSFSLPPKQSESIPVPAFQLDGKPSSLLESRAGAAAVVRSEATVAPAYQKEVAVQRGVTATLSTPTAEVQAPNSVSYVSSSNSSSKLQSVAALTTEARVQEPGPAGRVDSKSSSKYPDIMTHADSDDSASCDESSFNGSELATSPMKSNISELSRSEAAVVKGSGILYTAKEEKPLGGYGQLPLASKTVSAFPKASVFNRSKSQDSDCDELSEGDVFSNREEVMKQIAGQSVQQRWSLPLEKSKVGDMNHHRAAAATAAVPSSSSSGVLSKIVDKGKSAGATAISDSENEDEQDSSSEEEDDDDEFTENSMTASEDRDAHSERRDSHNPSNKAAVPLMPWRGSSDEAVDLSSSFDTSIPSPVRSQHGMPSLDITPNSIISPQMSSSPENMGDKRSSLKPLNPIGRILGPSTPVISSSALSSLKTMDYEKAKKTESSSLAAAAPLSSIQKSALSPAPGSSSASVTTAAAGPVLRSPQPILSGSLLSLGRKSVSAAAPASSLGPATPLPSNNKAAAEGTSKSAPSTYTNLGPAQSKAKAEEEDEDDGNLDFDASSWDEEDELEDSS